MYRSASACGWLTTPTSTPPTVTGQPVIINGQPASAASTVTNTTDNLVVLITV